MGMHPFYLALDSYLIWFYRLTDHGYVDFFIGTFVLAFICLLIGEFSISLAFLAIRTHIDRVTEEATKYQNLSIQALKMGEKDAYKTANKLANDAFGRAFFMQIGLSAARLWPMPLALIWMDYRFAEVGFQLPFLPWSFGYMAVFIVLYISAYFLFKRVKYRLWPFRRVKQILDSYQMQTQETKGLADLLPSGQRAEKS